jgi:CheY-like chemotaxis protein
MDLVEAMLSRRDEIAVVMVTSDDDPDLVDRDFEMGAYGYLAKPYREGDLLITVTNALRRKHLESQARAHQRELEQDVIAKSLEAERVRQLLRRSVESLERSRLETVHKLSLAVEMRDQVTGHHLSRMGVYCEEIARRIQLPGEICDSIALAGQMHDMQDSESPLLKLAESMRGPTTRRSTAAATRADCAATRSRWRDGSRPSRTSSMPSPGNGRIGRRCRSPLRPSSLPRAAGSTSTRWCWIRS